MRYGSDGHLCRLAVVIVVGQLSFGPIEVVVDMYGHIKVVVDTSVHVMVMVVLVL